MVVMNQRWYCKLYFQYNHWDRVPDPGYEYPPDTLITSEESDSNDKGDDGSNGSNHDKSVTGN